MTVKDFLSDKSFKQGFIRMRAYCEDGFNVSIQQSSHHYCKKDEVELGFPSKIEKSLVGYAENKRKPLDTVYGYVPIEIIEHVVEKHGGINKEKTLKEDKIAMGLN